MSVADAAKPPWVTVSRDVCQSFEQSSGLEWLETNHTGAFAMGTVAGVNTRRYHGLLVAPLKPPANRYSILSRVEERVAADGETFEMATVQYPGAVQPRGFELLQEFSRSPFPRWRYRAGPVEIAKTICLMDKQPCVLLRYEATRSCSLEVRLMLSYRDYHSLTHKNDAISSRYSTQPGRVTFSPYADLPSLTVLHNGTFEADGTWFLEQEYLRELERGLDFREDLFSPGSIAFGVTAERPAWMIAALHSSEPGAQLENPDIGSILDIEAKRREFHGGDPVEELLRRALDQFRIQRFDGQSSLIAGYPWFTDWTRDTLISLPALLKGGFEQRESRQILAMLAESRSHGILPNRFTDDQSQAEYNTGDASLWFMVAAYEFIEQTKDFDFLRKTVYPAARDIVNSHLSGTVYNIHVDAADHLLSAGTPETQLTWMDAKVRGIPVTPRNGKAVEINALWYNALQIIAQWSEQLGLPAEQGRFGAEAQLALSSFQQSFWNAERLCLYDVITPSGRDSRIRPNQIFALSLPFALLDPERGRLVLATVRDELLTPVGLRTLERGAGSYVPHFEGSMTERDTAYHQGTVWPWLLGPFIAAYLYAHEQSEQSISFCRQVLGGLEEYFSRYCLGSLPEVFDAEEPYRAGGCPAQLWSVAQFLIARERLNRLNTGR